MHTAVQKWFEIIGEASYKVTPEFKIMQPHVDWKNIEGLRHILVHEYFGVDLYKILELYKNDLPQLKTHIEKMYKEF